MPNVAIKDCTPSGDRFACTVEVATDNKKHTYHVELEMEYVKSLGWDIDSAEEMVRQSFVFLLDREPQEDILEHFNLRDIQKYFPEYEQHVKR